ncbi:MAG: hypothetical protein WCS99_05210 [Limisphaerales bacterium]
MKARLYLETTIVSYLVVRPSRDVKQRYLHEMAKRWWERRLAKYKAFVSESLLNELDADGIALPKQIRSKLENLPTLSLTSDASALAQAILNQQALPAEAERAAKHFAIAAVHGIPLLVSLNLRHLANAHNRHNLESVCRSFGHKCPAIGTPQQFMGADAEVDPIVAEVRKVKERIAASFNYDVRAMLSHYRERDEQLRRSGKVKFYEPATAT